MTSVTPQSERMVIPIFDPMVLLLVVDVEGDGTKHSCVMLLLYLAGGLLSRRCSGRNSWSSWNSWIA